MNKKANFGTVHRRYKTKNFFRLTSLSSLFSNLIIFDLPRHNKSSLHIFKMNRVFTELASKAPISSSKVARSCKMQSNLNTSCSSGSDVVFFRSLRINCVLLARLELTRLAVLARGVSATLLLFTLGEVEARTESALPHKFSKSFTFCRYSSMMQLRWYSF